MYNTGNTFKKTRMKNTFAVSFLSLIFLFLSQTLLCASNSVAAPRSMAGFGILPKKTINTSILGTNAFCNDPRFGTVAEQLDEVKNTLRLNYVRVLFAWDDNVQASSTAKPNFSFYDDIASHIPKGMTALVILTGIPSWMEDPANWIEGNPRKTFNNKWVKKVARRYAKNKKIIGYQIWNEPNDESNEHNQTLDIMESPSNYVEMLSYAWTTVKKFSRSKKVVTAATTAINQNYPETINYNRDMRDAGARDYSDIWAIHYYGEHIENVIRSKGLRVFARGLDKDIWITESGEKGTVKQLNYGRRIWPFLTKYVKGIKRIFQYQFTEDSPAKSTYGMKNPTGGQELSDLYIYLRDRKQEGR